MKAPVGLLSDRTVLRKQDGGAPPRQVRVCGAKRNNESPSGAFKRPNGLAQQDGGAPPRQVRVCGAKRNNEVPNGDFKRPNGLAKGKMEGPRPDKFAFVERSGTRSCQRQDGGAPPRQVPLYKTGKNRYNQIKSVCGAPGLTGAPCLPCFLRLRRCAGPSFLCRRFFL